MFSVHKIKNQDLEDNLNWMNLKYKIERLKNFI